MKEENNQKKGCSKPVVAFLGIAVVIIAAFLIVGLVKTCQADHEAETIENVQP